MKGSTMEPVPVDGHEELLTLARETFNPLEVQRVYMFDRRIGVGLPYGEPGMLIFVQWFNGKWYACHDLELGRCEPPVTSAETFITHMDDNAGP
jgi:hypothetical protein